MVSVGVGAQSLRLVLVDSLDLGHYVHSADFKPYIFDRAGTPGMARLARLDHLRCAVGFGGVGESIDARFPALLRNLDMAAKIPEPAAIVGRRRAVLGGFLSCSLALAGSKLRGLWALCFPA